MKQRSGTIDVKQKRSVSPRVLLMIAFIEGVMVISVELLGAKMLIPFYGNSLIVWTSVLGITIASLALGYFTGGILSQKTDLVKKISRALAISSLLILFMPTLAGLLFEWLYGISIYTGSVTAAILLMSPPLFILGTVSPLLIQQFSDLPRVSTGETDLGKTAGTIYALSTAGGIIFTFVVGFFALPHWGVSLSVLAISTALFLVSSYLYYEKRHLFLGVLFLFLAVKTFPGKEGTKPGNSKTLYESEGLLGQLKVVDIFDAASQTSFRYLFINGIPQTVITNENSPMKGSSGWPYSHKVAMLATLKHEAQNVLLLGIGGGSVARELTEKKMKIDLVDLDERMLGIAKKYFYLDNPLATFTCDDARHFVRTTKKRYDLIVMDVFNAEVQPSYMFTKESFSEMKDILNENGIMVFNFGELAKHPGASAYQSVCNTLLSEGLQVYCNFKEEQNINDVLIISSPGVIDFSGLKKESLNPCCYNQPWATDFIQQPVEKIAGPFANGIILTDDKPMLEILNAGTIKIWRDWAIKTYAVPDLEARRKLFK